MSDFRTFPSAVVDGGGSGGGSSASGGAIGLFPTVAPIYPSRTASTISNDLEGIIGDGDFFDLPTATSGTLVYKDSAGSILFTGTNTTVDAASQVWCNFMQDEVDEVLYILSANKSTNTFYLSSIDNTGSVTNIGNFSATAVDTWADWLACSMTRVADGSGNFELIGPAHRVEFTAAGALISETVGNVTNILAPAFKTSLSGIYIKITKTASSAANGSSVGILRLSVSTPLTASPEAKKVTVIDAPAMLMGLPTGQLGTALTFIPLQWRGTTALWSAATTNAVSIYARDAFSTAMSTFITNFNLDKGVEF